MRVFCCIQTVISRKTNSRPLHPKISFTTQQIYDRYLDERNSLMYGYIRAHNSLATIRLYITRRSVLLLAHIHTQQTHTLRTQLKTIRMNKFNSIIISLYPLEFKCALIYDYEYFRLPLLLSFYFKFGKSYYG